jgi:hypothetical protein
VEIKISSENKVRYAVRRKTMNFHDKQGKDEK